VGLSAAGRWSDPRGNATEEMVKPEYKYSLEIYEKALQHLESLPKDLRRQMGHAIDLLQRDFKGDIKKLKGHRNEYRLRVGNHRILFELNGNCITVYDCGDRKEIYDR
jgi:mRNA interferase RelE/StbE